MGAVMHRWRRDETADGWRCFLCRAFVGAEVIHRAELPPWPPEELPVLLIAELERCAPECRLIRYLPPGHGAGPLGVVWRAVFRTDHPTDPFVTHRFMLSPIAFERAAYDRRLLFDIVTDELHAMFAEVREFVEGQGNPTVLDVRLEEPTLEVLTWSIVDGYSVLHLPARGLYDVGPLDTYVRVWLQEKELTDA